MSKKANFCLDRLCCALKEEIMSRKNFLCVEGQIMSWKTILCYERLIMSRMTTSHNVLIFYNPTLRGFRCIIQWLFPIIC